MCGKEKERKCTETTLTTSFGSLSYDVEGGPNGDNNAWTAFSWAALTRVIESLNLQQPYSHLMRFFTSWLHLVG
jgi:hypothetical protein